jgi:hypothetical protein
LVSINLKNSDYVFPVSVFTGDTLAKLQAVGGSPNGLLAFQAVQGTTYQIAVGDAGGLTGSIEMDLQAPVVVATLLKSQGRSPNLALLSYATIPGQVLMLQRSYNGTTWQNVKTAKARGRIVTFAAQPAPARGIAYRAIVFDYLTP